MTESRLDPEVLGKSEWVELRTELHEWDDCGDEVLGYECLTRYWCREAVFEVYWVAEKAAGEDFSVYLTDDLQLAGFKQRLSYQPTLNWKRTLATKLGWHERAKDILRELSGTQLELFKE